MFFSADVLWVDGSVIFRSWIHFRHVRQLPVWLPSLHTIIRMFHGHSMRQGCKNSFIVACLLFRLHLHLLFALAVMAQSHDAQSAIRRLHHHSARPSTMMELSINADIPAISSVLSLTSVAPLLQPSRWMSMLLSCPLQPDVRVDLTWLELIRLLFILYS